MKFQYSIATAVTLALLQGCGGDGASPSINTSTNSAWTQGDYSKTSNEFANRCETPRTGLDPTRVTNHTQTKQVQRCKKNSFYVLLPMKPTFGTMKYRIETQAFTAVSLLISTHS